MTEEFIQSKTEIVNFNDLSGDFLNLRIGEEIPKFTIRRIRKVTNKAKSDNLSGVDYKYIIESEEGKLLTVNSWVLWNKISGVIKEAGSINITLELRHKGMEDYHVKSI